MNTTCRRCAAPVLLVRETGVRVALTGMVDAAPLSVFAALGRGPPIWERHPDWGWACVDFPRRRGHPLHTSHRCTTEPSATDHSERKDR